MSGNLLKGTQATKSIALASNSEWWRGIAPLTVYENTVEVLWGETLYVTLDIMVDKNCVLRFDTNNTGSGIVVNDNDSNRFDNIDWTPAKASEWVTHRWSWTNANESKNSKHVALTDFSTIGLEPGTHNEGDTTISVRNVMVTKNDFMAWAPAGGETLAGGGALMSANLLDGIKPEITQYGSMADGVITSSTPKDSWKDVAAWPITTGKFAENQTMHLGISAKWHSAAATSGTAWASVKYEDAAGNANNVAVQINGITTEWKRFSLSAVVPSGMRVVDFHISARNLDAAYDATNPVLSYGSPIVLAIASATLAWSAGILATVRYYQLAAPTAATPTVPTSSSSLGSWTETEPTADVTKVLWTCDRTAYADGTESWSKASKSTSYEAAKDAKSTATDAQSKAQEAQEQVLDVSARLNTNTGDITATIDSKVAPVQQGVDSNAADVKDLNDRLTSEIKTRRSFMRFSEESSDPTLTLGQTDSPAQVKLTNKQLQFLYLNTVVAYMSGDALLINNAKILQQLQLGGFTFVPRDNGNLAFKWVGGDS